MSTNLSKKNKKADKHRLLKPPSSLTYGAGSTGGEASHKLTLDEIPSHNHRQYVTAATGNGTGIRTDYSDDARSNPYDQGINTGTAGGSKAHNNMPPYLAVYMWKRTA